MCIFFFAPRLGITHFRGPLAQAATLARTSVEARQSTGQLRLSGEVARTVTSLLLWAGKLLLFHGFGFRGREWSCLSWTWIFVSNLGIRFLSFSSTCSISCRDLARGWFLVALRPTCLRGFEFVSLGSSVACWTS